MSWPRCWPQCWSALGDSLMHWQPIVQSLSSDWFSELLRERLAEVYARPEECRPARPLPQKARNLPEPLPFIITTRVPLWYKDPSDKTTEPQLLFGGFGTSLSFFSGGFGSASAFSLPALAPASAFSLAALAHWPQLFPCRLHLLRQRVSLC